MAEVSDSELIALFRNEATRNNAFSLIVKQYQKKLYWHIRKIIIDHDDTDDVLQNTFIKAWKGLDNFKEESQLFTWLYRIATNEALSFLRQKARNNAVPYEEVEGVLAHSLEDDRFFKGDEIQKLLQLAILSLPEKQRIVFNMRYYDELPYEKMSDILETSVGALKASYHHAAKKIEEYLLNHVNK
jgi:RNA polymerase sigma-70 factor (ECF subfamily)